jgi:predicted dehydrogenase
MMEDKRLKSLIIGYGSIGRRHESVLNQLGSETAIVSGHAEVAYRTPEAGLEHFQPDYVVVANRTSEHMETLDRLEVAGFSGPCLVEKPLSGECPKSFSDYSFRLRVGYVLRFHPLFIAAADVLQGQSIYSIHAYAGQYLPDWRPDTDYRESYSSRKEQGGGVLRDLSHELDYLQALAGTWRKVAALGGHFSKLEINSDDVFGLLFEAEHCPVISCQVNYLDRNLRRDCTIQYEGGTLHLDFVGNRLIHSGTEQLFQVERNDLFRAMHLSALDQESKEGCTLDEGMDTLTLIEAAERSRNEHTWVCRINQ